MKKRIIITVFILGAMLCGCAEGRHYEVIADGIVDLPVQIPEEITVQIPEGTVYTALSGSDWQYYEGENCRFIVETYPSGDLDKTLKKVTGFQKAQLDLFKTDQNGMHKYLCAWSAVSEECPLVGRCAILDDGIYHYCLSVLVDAEAYSEKQDMIEDVFARYSLD